MTTAHVEKFAEIVSKDPALLAKLGLDKANADAAAASASMAAFITNAVIEAKAHGLEFTEAEAHAFMADQAAAAARGELSDTQLEAVAGGKRWHTQRKSFEQTYVYDPVKNSGARFHKLVDKGGADDSHPGFGPSIE
jgi:hypothetical protein